MSLSSLLHLSFFFYGYFFFYYHLIYLFSKFPFGLDQPAINHIFPVSKSMGIDVYTLYTCKKNFMNGFFSCFVWYRICGQWSIPSRSCWYQMFPWCVRARIYSPLNVILLLLFLFANLLQTLLCYDCVFLFH